MPLFVTRYCKECMSTKENIFLMQILCQILQGHKIPYEYYFKSLLFSAFISSWKLKRAN